MELIFAKEQMSQGTPMVRKAWTDPCRIIRAANESDYEFINYPVSGIFVDACQNRNCDCKIIIYQPTPEDLKANDWVEAVNVA